ncbi:TetR/AcrR family transcriptional regulator [Aquihabitans daechungensis]|uniref:TetR/AcrR family transcriptional regulator n=1 Tax=Aquihabitans daechungensis TaxID=1052257 RepID=UPI003BA0A338
MTDPSPPARPRGRDQIRTALIESTLDLLESKGLDLSIRQIAERADLPHSVIGRYFGSKDELVRSAIDSTLPADRQAAQDLESAEQAAIAVFDSGSERPERIRILAQLLQAGMDPREIRSEAPLIRSLVKHIEEEQPTHADPRLIAAAITAMSMGWALTEDYIVDHAGIDVLDREAVRQEMKTLMLRLL